MYRDEGFLPEAFRNFLALLGWAPGGDEEFLRTKELIEKFSLSGVSRTNGVFDRPKLEWFNTQYLQKLPIEDLLPFVEAELKRSGLWKEEWASGPGHEWFSNTVDLLRPRVRFLPDFSILVARLLQRRFRNRRSRQNKILERPQSSRPDARPGRRPGGPDRMESRRLRPRLPRRSRIRRRKSRPPDQRHPRRHRRPIRSPAPLRHHGRPRPRPSRPPPPRLLPPIIRLVYLQDGTWVPHPFGFQRVRV